MIVYRTSFATCDKAAWCNTAKASNFGEKTIFVS